MGASMSVITLPSYPRGSPDAVVKNTKATSKVSYLIILPIEPLEVLMLRKV